MKLIDYGKWTVITRNAIYGERVEVIHRPGILYRPLINESYFYYLYHGQAYSLDDYELLK